MKKLTAPYGAPASEHILNGSGITEAQLKKLFKDKCIRIDGVTHKKDTEVSEGSIIEIQFEELRPDLIDRPTVVYEDENLLILNKPRGVSCEYTEKDVPSTLRFADERMKTAGEYNADILAIAYPATVIDPTTGGLVIVAKDEKVYSCIAEAVRQRRIRRFFTAITKKPPMHLGELRGYMLTNKKTGAVKLSGKAGNMSQPVMTRLSVKESYDELALIEAEPLTNKPHQVRAMLAHCGAAVLGDTLFGDAAINKKYGVWQEALWLTKITFLVGENSMLSYLNNKSFECEAVMPYIEY